MLQLLPLFCFRSVMSFDLPVYQLSDFKEIANKSNDLQLRKSKTRVSASYLTSDHDCTSMHWRGKHAHDTSVSRHSLSVGCPVLSNPGMKFYV